MWFFLGCCVIATVLYFGLAKLTRVVTAISVVFERTINTAAIRSGQPPITSEADAEFFSRKH